MDIEGVQVALQKRASLFLVGAFQSNPKLCSKFFGDVMGRQYSS